MEQNGWVEYENFAERIGFTQVHNAVLCSTVICPEAKIVYAVLKKFAWQDPDCYPGMKRIAQSCNMSEKRARKHRREIEREVDAKGRVKREADAVPLVETRRRGQGRTNRYVFKDVTKLLDQLEPEESLNGRINHSGMNKTNYTERTPCADNEYAEYKYTDYEDNGAGSGSAGPAVTFSKSPTTNQGSKKKSGTAGESGCGSRNSATGEFNSAGPGEAGPAGTAPKHTEIRSWWQFYRQRAEQAGIAVSERDPKIIGANLPKLAKREDVSKADMHKVVDTLLSRAANGIPPGSPQQALERIREANREPDPYADLIGFQASGNIAKELAAMGRLDADGRITAPSSLRSEIK